MLQVVKEPGPQGFEWIDITDPGIDELTRIAERYHLHASAVQDCLQPEHLPKYELFEDTHFIITRYFDKECPRHSNDIHDLSRKLSIFINNRFIITVHRKVFPPYELVKERYKSSENLMEIVSRIFKCTLSTYQEPLEKLDQDFEYYESRLFLKKRIPDLLKSLYGIKRRIYVIRKVINLCKEPIDKLAQVQKKSPAYQDLKDYYLNLDTQIEETYESINTLLSVYISISSQRTNEVMRTLTVFTAFFLPLTFIVGVYGMNFDYMPELRQHYGYPAVMILMLVITAGIWIWFKRKKWL